MTLQERRADLVQQWERARATMEQITGAIRMLDQLIAEETAHASSVESATALHGDEVRGGEGGQANGAGHDDLAAARLRRDQNEEAAGPKTADP